MNQAFYAQESADVVPIDQIILYPKQSIAALMLPKGDFRIRAINESGKVLGQYEKNQDKKANRISCRLSPQIDERYKWND